MAIGRALPKFEDPPIVEVVCGVLFESLPGLDPAVTGLFWNERREDFPHRQFYEALASPAQAPAFSVAFGPNPPIPPVRTWLLSAAGDLVLQIQHDRFYVNWRLQADAPYPRFNSRGGETGLLDRVEETFGAFRAFCTRELKAPRVIAVELAKIDQFRQGRHWKDAGDLAALVPALAPVLTLGGAAATAALRFADPRDQGGLLVSAEPLVVVGREGRPASALQIETRRTVAIADGSMDLRAGFVKANDEINDVFAQLIPEREWPRFRRGWTP